MSGLAPDDGRSAGLADRVGDARFVLPGEAAHGRTVPTPLGPWAAAGRAA